MARQSVITQKKRGPPATGKGELIGVRLQPPQMTALDAWIAQQNEQQSRPEAIRRLIELGLANARLGKPRSKKAASKASKLAADTIDHLADQSAPTEEREKRKRRLLKGPAEFRELRADLPRVKG